MNKTYHFISGLPRSGSTLLSAILKQNPRFTAGISDPLQMYANSIIRDTSSAVGMAAVVNNERQIELIRDLFDSYYKHGNEVCFNTNRGWAADTALLATLFPKFKMIVCLRDIQWILNSFELLHNKNPLTIKPIYHHQQLSTVYERTNMLLGNIPNFSGYVSAPVNNIRQSMFCREVSQICYVEYDTLVKHPKFAMQQIYQFLGESWFEHDFNNVEDSYDEFDEQTKIIGLHDVRKRVEYKPQQVVIPDDIWHQAEPLSFWKNNFDKRRLNWISAAPGKQL